jgi:hypothetical protein
MLAADLVSYRQLLTVAVGLCLHFLENLAPLESGEVKSRRNGG